MKLILLLKPQEQILPKIAIVGLGNADAEYNGTRHNLGAFWLDVMARTMGVSFTSNKRCQGRLAQGAWQGYECLLYHPHTYMNTSGTAVAALLRQLPSYQMHELLIVHDELELAAGQYKYKAGGGHKGHNGLRHIIAVLGNNSFLRLSLGIGRPPLGHDVAAYVLSRPSPAERVMLQEAVNTSITHFSDQLPEQAKEL